MHTITIPSIILVIYFVLLLFGFFVAKQERKKHKKQMEKMQALGADFTTVSRKLGALSKELRDSRLELERVPK